MSSHHVIREGQEPPVVIMDAAAVAHPALQAMLEWSPLVIACGAAVPELLIKDIKTDFILAPQNEQEQWVNVFRNRYPVTILPLNGTHELSQRITAILETTDVKTVHVFANGIEFLHQFETLPGAVYFTESVRYTWYADGKFRKWVLAGHQLEIIGRYGKISGDVRQNGMVIHVISDGVVEIDELEKTWIREPMT